MSDRFIYRKAVISDVNAMRELISYFAAKDEMLPRSLNQIYEALRDFWVCASDGGIEGCCALHIVWEDLAEVRSLAVSPEYQGKGIGKELVLRALDEARQLGLPRVFTLTYKPAFFKQFNFREIDKKLLPHKVWTECINCPKFPDCGEVALLLEL